MDRKRRQGTGDRGVHRVLRDLENDTGGVGNGTFSGPVTLTTATHGESYFGSNLGWGPRDVEACDLNGDLLPDLAVTNSGGTLSVFLATGGGSFGPRADYPVSFQANAAGANDNGSSQ